MPLFLSGSRWRRRRSRAAAASWCPGSPRGRSGRCDCVHRLPPLRTRPGRIRSAPVVVGCSPRRDGSRARAFQAVQVSRSAPDPDLRRAEPGRVGGPVVELVLRVAFGGDPRPVVLDLVARSPRRPSPAPARRSRRSPRRTSTPRCQVSIDTRSPAGQDVVQVQRALVRDRVVGLGLQVARGVLQRLAAAPGVRRRSGRGPRASPLPYRPSRWSIRSTPRSRTARPGSPCCWTSAS